MRSVSRRRLASTVVSLLREQPKKQGHIMQALAAYLVEHKQQKYADLLLLDIAHELQQADGHLYADVTSAFPLDSAARAELTHYLAKHAGAKTVELNERTNPALLAGAVVRTADQELNTSAAAKLTKLRSLNMSREA
jgi:F0F1-type ATP synthase delta subunit